MAERMAMTSLSEPSSKAQGEDRVISEWCGEAQTPLPTQRSPGSMATSHGEMDGHDPASHFNA